MGNKDYFEEAYRRTIKLEVTEERVQKSITDYTKNEKEPVIIAEPLKDVRYNQIINQDCLKGMQLLDSNSIDLIVTDPPYQLSSTSKARPDQSGDKEVPFSRQQSRIPVGFMGKEWDVLPTLDIWKEAFRVLKAGAFAFILMTPRQDSHYRCLRDLEEAGFVISFSPMFWTYASGFPKASNISKMVDKRNERTTEDYKKLGEYLKDKIIDSDIICSKKVGFSSALVRFWRLGERIPNKETWIKLKEIYNLSNEFDELINRVEAEREVVGMKNAGLGSGKTYAFTDKNKTDGIVDVTISATPQAKALDGSYGGFQPKPAVEVIIVAMKPLEEKTYVDQSLKNSKGITWLDDCRVPYETEYTPELRGNLNTTSEQKYGYKECVEIGSSKGRFPANLLCSDDVLNDGSITKASGGDIIQNTKGYFNEGEDYHIHRPNDSGSFSRYFSLDAWWQERIKKLPEAVRKTFPFLIIPKASSSEKNKGLDEWNEPTLRPSGVAFNKHSGVHSEKKKGNIHPTTKPIQLMSYLITLGSREGDIVLDPFIGSGTTAISARMLSRKFIGWEKDKEYFKIAQARIDNVMAQKKLSEGF